MDKTAVKTSKYNRVVLIPTDFSEVCENAIHHGMELARTLNYSVCILHVINRESKSRLKKENLTTDSINEKLAGYKNLYQTDDTLKVETIAREGSIFEVIRSVAEEVKANLMIMGTHGKKGLQYLFGSYALRVVLDSPCPVVVVQKRSFGKGYHNIVFPVSNDLEVRQKVQWAIMIAKLFGSTIRLFQANESDESLNQRIRFITSQITSMFDEKQVPYEIVLGEKKEDFADQVVAYSIKTGCDMIMVMTVPQVDVPGFSVSAWDEKMMFNEAGIPVMC
ncbi:MAG TPA: universal stress protein, partial [Bacteroidales bacterium]|nr:universal stress protein [Bacteroidales bacterium]